ncbi:MAG: hypothetical protein H0T77_08810, partial [Pyrinomonadaceae bacterium]|nr:hypothetical protein [Pyrinomonadaceae bacterium]
VVMRDGQAVAELRGVDISQDNIIHAMAEGASPTAVRQNVEHEGA